VNVKGIAELNPSLFPAAAEAPKALACALNEILVERKVRGL
jgi:hypothetical protein